MKYFVKQQSYYGAKWYGPFSSKLSANKAARNIATNVKGAVAEVFTSHEILNDALSDNIDAPEYIWEILRDDTRHFTQCSSCGMLIRATGDQTMCDDCKEATSTLQELRCIICYKLMGYTTDGYHDTLTHVCSKECYELYLQTV